VHHEIQEVPEITDAKPSKRLYTFLGAFFLTICRNLALKQATFRINEIACSGGL
jgi:hypothetical protein